MARSRFSRCFPSFLPKPLQVQFDFLTPGRKEAFMSSKERVSYEAIKAPVN